MTLPVFFHDFDFVAFDFDDTLTDFVQADTLALEAVRARCCPDVAGPEFLNAAVAEIMAFHDRVERGQSDPLHMDGERLTRTLQRYEVRLTPELLALYVQQLRHFTAPLPGARELVDVLKGTGLPLALLTNAYDGAGQRARVACCFPDTPFDVVVVAGEVGPLKPDPFPFRVMAQALNLAPERGVYIGDSPRYDVTGARNAGMQAVIVHEKERVRQQGLTLGASRAVGSLSELYRLDN